MRIGLFTALFGDKSRGEVLEIAQKLGLGCLEFGAGAYPGDSHIGVQELLGSESARQKVLDDCAKHGIEISALSVHGNPVHPDESIAQAHHQAFLDGVKLAGMLGVKTVNGFSGCPGGSKDCKTPNWVTCAWPDEFRDILEYQWNDVLIPYWTKQADYLADNNVNFAIEMHPGFTVFNNEGILKLRKECGANAGRIGANFDPSHLWWQGIDPIVSLTELGREGAIYHVHAKDLKINSQNSSHNGNLDVKSYGDIAGRSWVFRSVGYGHGVEWWKEFVSCLRTYGYDHVLSIEHEDGLMSPMEGLSKAISVLKEATIEEAAGEMFWAKD